MNSPVLIASPPRSGSSLTGSILWRAGYFGGTMKPGDQYNRHGYFENVAINKLVGNYLRLHDKRGQGKDFHPVCLDADVVKFGAKVVGILAAEGLKPRAPWFYKDNKLLLCWRLWRRHFPDAKWIFAHRDREQNIRSILATPFMDACKTREKAEAALDYYTAVQLEIIDLGFCDYFILDVKALLAGSVSEAKRLSRFLGADVTFAARSCVDKSLWHYAE